MSTSNARRLKTTVMFPWKTMAIPKKGIRKITVENVQYYFTVELESYGFSIVVTIGLVENPNKRFSFSVKQGDPNLTFIKEDKVGVVTPKLVHQAINYANVKTSWASSKEYVCLSYSEGHFNI